MLDTDTIAAIATAPGSGGIGIVRLSGNKANHLAKQIVEQDLRPRYAHYCPFKTSSGEIIDKGIVLFFPAPHSFTGEQVVEFHCHGGAVILDALLQEVIRLGARQARPGEFSERAFLNDKIDLVQAEAIADLIASKTTTAAKSAMQSLSGAFSTKINQLIEQVIALRVYVEAAIDFPDEEVDFLSDQHIVDGLDALLATLNAISTQAHRGYRLAEGLSLVIIGKPNAGKSSLLNLLAGDDFAIVNHQAGTTRDVLREDIQLDGLPLRIIDTAGLRDASDEIEQEGIQRAKREIEKADVVLFMRDASLHAADTNDDSQLIESELNECGVLLNDNHQLIVINNKIDLLEYPQPPARRGHHQSLPFLEISLSAKHGDGAELLIDELKKLAGLGTQTASLVESQETPIIARRRHLEALRKAQLAVEQAKQQLLHYRAGELAAEDLRQAQQYLSEITGAYTSDDLLGAIFSSFCIGK